MNSVIEFIKNYYLRIGAFLGIYLFTTPSAMALSAGQRDILEFRKLFQSQFMDAIQKAFYDHEFLKLSGGFLGGVFGILCVYAISMEVVRTHDESKRLTNLTNIALHMVFVFWIFGEMTPPTRVSFPGSSANMGSYLKSGSLGLNPAKGGSRLSGVDLDYSYGNQKKTIDRDFYQFLAKTFDEISSLYFGSANSLSQRFGELQVRQGQFLDSFTYMVLSCSEADANCRQTAWKFVKAGSFDSADVDRILKAQKDKTGKDTSKAGVEDDGFFAAAMRPIMGAITEVKGFFLKVVSPGWILNIVLKVASFFRDLAQIFITLIFAMFVPLTFFFVKLFSIFLVVPKLRPKIWATYKSLFAWTLFGFVSNLTMYIFIVLLDALNSATVVSMDTLINGAGASTVGSKILSVLTTNSMFSLAIILLQLFAITKIPDWCRKLMDLNIDFAIGAGQSIMNMAISMATGVVTGGVGLAATAVPGAGVIAGAGIRKIGKGIGAGLNKRDSLKSAGLAGKDAAKRRAGGQAPAGVAMAKGGGAGGGQGFGGAGGDGGGSKSVNVSGGQIDSRGQGSPVSMFKDDNPDGLGKKEKKNKKDGMIQSGLDAATKEKLGIEKKPSLMKKGAAGLGKASWNSALAATAALPALTKAALTGDMKGFAGALGTGAAGIGKSFASEGAQFAGEIADRGSDAIIDKTINSETFDNMFGKKVSSSEEVDDVLSNNAAMLAEGKAEVLDDESEKQFDDIVNRAAIGKTISSTEADAITSMSNNTNLSDEQQKSLRLAKEKNSGFQKSLDKSKAKSTRATQSSMDKLSGINSKMSALEEAKSSMSDSAYSKQRDSLLMKQSTALNDMNRGLSSGSMSMDYMQSEQSQEQMAPVMSNMSNNYLDMEKEKTDNGLSEYTELEKEFNKASAEKNEELANQYKEKMDVSRDNLMTQASILNNSDKGRNVLFDDNIRSGLESSGALAGIGLESKDFDLGKTKEEASAMEHAAYLDMAENSQEQVKVFEENQKEMYSQRTALEKSISQEALNGDFEKTQQLRENLNELTERIDKTSENSLNTDRYDTIAQAYAHQERIKSFEKQVGDGFNYLNENEKIEYENYKKRMKEIQVVMNKLEVTPSDLKSFSKELSKKLEKKNKN